MLTQNQLLGFWAGHGPARVTFQSTSSSTADSSEYTFSGVALGPINEKRLIVIWHSASSRTITGLTVDGIAATLIGGEFGTNTIELWYAESSGSTSGDVVVTLSGDEGRCGVDCYSATGLSSSAIAGSEIDTEVSGSHVVDVAIDVPAGGFVIAAAFGGGTSGRTTIWANADEKSDFLMNSRTHSSASRNFDTAQSGLAVSATFSGSTGSGSRLYVASFGATG